MPRLSRHTGQDQKFREGYLMQAILGSWSVMFLLVALSGGTSAQSKGRNQTLVVNGRVGEAGIVEMNGREYVDLEAFARIANGSLSFEGNRIILGVPAAPEAPAAAPVGDPGTAAGLQGAGRRLGGTSGRRFRSRARRGPRRSRASTPDADGVQHRRRKGAKRSLASIPDFHRHQNQASRAELCRPGRATPPI